MSTAAGRETFLPTQQEDNQRLKRTVQERSILNNLARAIGVTLN